MKHTALPWKSKYVQVADKWEILGKSDDGSEKWIGVMIWGAEPEDIANNEFIIRACNSHYELRESLEDIVKFVCEINPFCLINPKVENAIKILGKAKGK